MRFKSSFTIPAVAAISFCLIGPTVPAAADILHVPGDYPTIQEAIDAAMDGDEVEVHPGTYNENINFLGKAISVRSSDGAGVTTIDAGGAGPVVICISDEGPDTILDGFTITGGNTDFGGGMANFNSSPTIIDCAFLNNQALGPCEFDCMGTGGGMYNSNSSPIVTNCTFSGNTTNGNGGGMANWEGSSPTVTNCTFSGNLASGFGRGGGMYNKNSSPTVTNCTFSGNSASDFGPGGGMANIFFSNPTLTNCTFNGNSAGIGGGMYNIFFSSPTVTNCTFSGNTATGAFAIGGGMYNEDSSPTVINCTFSGNAATETGGGMYNEDSSPTVTNCILWGDSPSEILDVGKSVTTVSYSDVQGGWPGTGNIDVDPMFVAPGSGDLRLMPGSPCIDAADNTAVPKEIITDLDGNPRFVDDPATDDTGFGDPPIVDMGAYEFQVMNCPWDMNGDGVVDHHDILEVVHNLGRCDDPDNCPWDVNGDGIVNGRDVAAVARHFGSCP